MTDSEFRTAVRITFGEEVVTEGFMERLFEKLRSENVHIERIYHVATMRPGALEIWAKVPDPRGEFERRLSITADLRTERSQDIRTPHKSLPGDDGPRGEPHAGESYIPEE